MNPKLAIIIFSKDRALQLHACIASLKRYAQYCDQVDIHILYKTEKYQYQYNQLAAEFDKVSFVQETNLVKQLQQIITNYDAVMFVVDDTLFYRNFDLAVCLHQLFFRDRVLGFSLRLGRNVNWSHIQNSSMKQPTFQKIDDNYLQFTWLGSERDFGYPLEVSSSIYRSKDVYPLLNDVKGDPGVIEAHLSRKKCLFAQSKPHLLCFSTSVAFAVPVNIVRDRTVCPAGREYSYSIEKLVLLFDAGKRIDISTPKLINSCHQEIEYKFII